MKTIAEIMSEPATVEEIIRKANAINERLKEVENMPELVTVPAWFDEELPKWQDLEWEKSFLIDSDIDERAEYWCVTATANGVTYEGTATYIHDTLEIVEDIEIKKL